MDWTAWAISVRKIASVSKAFPAPEAARTKADVSSRFPLLRRCAAATIPQSSGCQVCCCCLPTCPHCSGRCLTSIYLVPFVPTVVLLAARDSGDPGPLDQGPFPLALSGIGSRGQIPAQQQQQMHTNDGCRVEGTRPVASWLERFTCNSCLRAPGMQ